MQNPTNMSNAIAPPCGQSKPLLILAAVTLPPSHYKQLLYVILNKT